VGRGEVGLVRRLLLVLLLVPLTAASAATAAPDPVSTLDGAVGDRGARRITFVKTIGDRTDLRGLGRSGSWFAHFDAADPVAGAPTAARARDALPSWVGAFNHTEHPGDPGCTGAGDLDRGCLPTYNFRTFSQDGPARSAGGHARWAALRLPNGECGGAGAIVDPHTAGSNNNNTINRIQLQDGVPERFFIGILTDTTDGAHDPDRLEVRGNVGVIDQRQEVAPTQVEAASAPSAADLVGNGRPDVHVFLVEGFRSGDYLKLRLRGATTPASFSGVVFDEAEPSVSPGGRRGCRPGGGALG
jgi:hypothetical protein